MVKRRNKMHLTRSETGVFKRVWRKDLNQTPLTAKLDEMEIGESFVINGNRTDIQLMRVNVSAWGRRHKKKFSITKQGALHICTRVSRPYLDSVS